MNFTEPELLAALRAWNTNSSLPPHERMRKALKAAQDVTASRLPSHPLATQWRLKLSEAHDEIDRLQKENRKLRRVDRAVETGVWPTNGIDIPPPR
jgi:hypothetical protein